MIMANITKLNLKGTEYYLTDLEAQNKIVELTENTYKKDEVDSLIEAIDNKIPAPYDDTDIKGRVSTLEAIDHSKYLTEHQDISGKADKSDTYTKAEVDAAVAGVDVSEQLTDYAKKADVYTKTESDGKYQLKGTYLTEHQDISGKVDKEDGKGLSSNDYTDEDKAKVAATPTFWVGTQAEYDAIATKDNNTFYYIAE